MFQGANKKASPSLPFNLERKTPMPSKAVMESTSTGFTKLPVIKVIVRSSLFQGLFFIVTGLQDNHKAKIIELLESHSGKVLDDYPKDITSDKLLVIGHASGCRRPSYITALALSMRIIHSNWVRIMIAY